MRRPAAYGRAIGAILAFLLIGLLVKYEQVRLTVELQGLFDPPSLVNHARQIWMTLRFSWQEWAIASGLLAVVLVWRRAVPEPGRATRAALWLLYGVLGAGAVIGVLGIKYYALYHGHMTVAEAENVMWARQILASARESVSVWTASAIGALLLIGLPWAAARFFRTAPARALRAAHVTFAALVLITAVTWAAGRPRMLEARLEPNPMVWFLWGPWATYVELPPIETLSVIGPRERAHALSERPRNIILFVLESTPASAVAGYAADVAAADAAAGRKLFADYGSEITLFENVYAVSPNSVASLLSVLTGHSPLPDNPSAVRASVGWPTLAEVVAAEGFQTEFYLSGPSNFLIDDIVGRGFDRVLHMDSAWPRAGQHARLDWGYDDRLLVDEARAFLDAQTAGSPPFLLMLHTSNPHHPYQSGSIPGLNDAADQKQRHQQLVRHTMDQLADLYASLKASGLAETTAVLAFGDHGEAFGEHRGNYIHSKELFRENLHVPLLLLHPRRLGLPPRIGQLGSLDDIMPTTLDLLGIEAPSGTGMSLLFEAPERVVFMATPYGPGVVGFRDARYFYAMSRTGRELLFDYGADPRERHNLRDERPDLIAAFRARLGIGRSGS